jgi:hypothetical protein
MWTKKNVGQICKTCNRPVEVIHEQPGYKLISCSAFCAEVSSEHKVAWEQRKVGWEQRKADGELTYGPCNGCGYAIEDVWAGPDAVWHCSTCAEAEVKKKLEVDLDKALTALRAIAQIVVDNGCECDCEHHPEDHVAEGEEEEDEEPCERCWACRIDRELPSNLNR